MIHCPALAPHRPEFFPFHLWLSCVVMSKEFISFLPHFQMAQPTPHILSEDAEHSSQPAAWTHKDLLHLASQHLPFRAFSFLLFPLAIAQWNHIPILESNFSTSVPGKLFFWLNGFAYWPPILLFSIWPLRYFVFFLQFSSRLNNSSSVSIQGLHLNILRERCWECSCASLTYSGKPSHNGKHFKNCCMTAAYEDEPRKRKE